MLRYLVILCLFASLVLALGCGKNAAVAPEAKTAQPIEASNKFTIAGSGSNIPVTKKLAEAYYAKTGVVIDIPGGIGNDGAIDALKTGDIDLSILSRPLTAAELSAGLKAIPYARVGIVLAAHAGVPDTNFSTTDIVDILKGAKTTWVDGTTIYVFVRQTTEPANQIFSALLPGYKEALSEANRNHRWELIYLDSDMAYTIGKTKGSLGITNTTYVATMRPNIKPLGLNGIVPTLENIRTGYYKPVKDLSFVYKGSPSSQATKFLEFVFTDEGRETLTNWGAVPLER